ncbi:MAG: UDP-N-acetylmuramate dehydrogenase [Chlamydiales bacterium]|nr:UDP-N-acetylmuramate dehydrogenase [Chlamydiales bacterium]
MLKLQQGRSLKEFSTFGIGGKIHLFAEIFSIGQMEEAFQWIRKENLPFFILGKGSNCLFSDLGFNGLVLLNKMDRCQWKEARVIVESGYSFSLLGIQSARKKLSGLEFASGIPATVGGAVFMNAGASGSETCGALESVDFLHLEGDIVHYSKEQLEFGYRFSSFQKKQGVILSAVFTFQELEEARTKQLAIIEKRVNTQPYQDKSIGCIFQNPSPTISAGKLIDDCGLKGIRIGGIQISPLHANFMINVGEASAKDVLEMIHLVQQRVLQETGYVLKPEIRMVEPS